MKDRIDPEQLHCQLPITKQSTVQLAHGAGGQLSNRLINDLFIWAFGNEELNKQNDSAILSLPIGKISFSTDSFVVDPIFFPGGDIGDLAVNGTINDVAMSGAIPRYLSCGFIIEEGFPLDDLKRIVISMKKASEKANVKIVTGDTKVVNKGKGDKLFINTTGIGVVEHHYNIGAEYIKPGDRIILSGGIAEHGICILSQRENLSFESKIRSDTAALHELVQVALQAGREAVHAFRDPTRGGVAATLNEFARSAKVQIRIQERLIPVKGNVAAACELLGLDPLYVANEGKCLVVVEQARSEAVLKAIRAHQLGQEAVIIGEVIAGDSHSVQIQTLLGSWRFVDMPVGEQLPRIC